MCARAHARDGAVWMATSGHKQGRRVSHWQKVISLHECGSTSWDFSSPFRLVRDTDTSTVHVRCVYFEGSRVVSHLVKINVWGTLSGVSEVLQPSCGWWVWIFQLFLPPKNIPNYFGLPFGYLELNCKGNEAKTARETIILLSQTTIFKAKQAVVLAATRYVLFTFWFALRSRCMWCCRPLPDSPS